MNPPVVISEGGRQYTGPEGFVAGSSADYGFVILLEHGSGTVFRFQALIGSQLQGKIFKRSYGAISNRPSSLYMLHSVCRCSVATCPVSPLNCPSKIRILLVVHPPSRTSTFVLFGTRTTRPDLINSSMPYLSYFTDEFTSLSSALSVTATHT